MEVLFTVRVWETTILMRTPRPGYVLGLILEACIQYQAHTSHVDVLHATAHFLRTTYTAAFTVSVKSMKIGSGFTNLTADLIQDVCDLKHP